MPRLMPGALSMPCSTTGRIADGSHLCRSSSDTLVKFETLFHVETKMQPASRLITVGIVYFQVLKLFLFDREKCICDFIVNIHYVSPHQAHRYISLEK